MPNLTVLTNVFSRDISKRRSRPCTDPTNADLLFVKVIGHVIHHNIRYGTRQQLRCTLLCLMQVMKIIVFNFIYRKKKCLSQLRLSKTYLKVDLPSAS
jgi:hypothetical protein